MIQTDRIISGQMWMSTTEPSLGIGRVKKYKDGCIDMLFPLACVTRRYSVTNAPLERVVFDAGDRIMLADGNVVFISGSICDKGLLYYKSGNRTICETEVSDKNVVETCLRSLLSGEFGKSSEFDLRYATLLTRNYAAKASCRDMAGAKINLMPHQIFIADRITGRYAPRAILADEAGLGKTIEACLIIKRLISRGYHKILIVTPEHLIIQWFSELYRKFNMTFGFVDDTYHAKQKKEDAGFKPVEKNDRLILSFNLLENDAEIQKQVLKKKWDMIVIDEAHRLLDGTPLYGIIEKISDYGRGMLLLTATPDYPGIEHYFARLKLIDRFSFNSFDRFFWELDQYHQIAGIYDGIKSGEQIDGSGMELLYGLLKNSNGYEHLLKNNSVKLDHASKKEILRFLKLRHGISRYLFRNTRKNIGDFPSRRLYFIPLKNDNERIMNLLVDEFKFDSENKPLCHGYDLKDDPRINWLKEIIDENKNGKMLLICRSTEKVLAISKALAGIAHTGKDWRFEIFHEKMELIERDRKSAAFQNDKNVRLLISSEIGSEGRNFQFCSKLIFWDMPFRPDLIEQRIGRIDRIGQTKDIDIYFPFISGSPQEYIIDWLHRGLDAFSTSLQGCETVFGSHLEFLKKLAISFSKMISAFSSGKALSLEMAERNEMQLQMEELIGESRIQKKSVMQKMENGRDRLVEINSYDAHEASLLVETIKKYDDDPLIEYYINDFFESIGVKQDVIDESFLKKSRSHDSRRRSSSEKPKDCHARQSYKLAFDTADADLFPELKGIDYVMTYDRNLAVEREDFDFFSIDHPYMERVFHFVLGSSRGTSSLAMMSGNDNLLKAEMIFIIETLSPERLNIGRFMPDMHIRIVIDENQNDMTDDYEPDDISGLKDAPPDLYNREKDRIGKKIIDMVKCAKNLAYKKSASLMTRSKENVTGIYGKETGRLGILKRANSSIKSEEIDFIEKEKNEILGYLDNAILRLDMIKVIYGTDSF